MAKLSTTPITSGYASTSALNDNFDLIEVALENTLSRDGTAPNQMNADLDMNGKKILNVPTPVSATDVVRLQDVTGTGAKAISAWKGTWSGATTYALNEAVKYNGSSYISLQATNLNKNPVTETTWWDKMVDKGDIGATGPTGSTGATGSTGPAAWTTVAAWLTSTPYTNGPPASVVTNGGETYVCLVAHTSGTFATDLSAGNWTKVAAKGADGAGIGDLLAANNLSDVVNAATARTNLGLGTTNSPSFENVALTGTGGVAGYTDFTNGTEVANPAAGVSRLHGETAGNFPQLEIVDSTGVHVVLGRDSVIVVRNTSGATITVKQVVYVTGSTGVIPNVSLARSDSLTTLASTIGLVLDASIAHNAYGRVMTLGTLDAVNTSAFASGVTLYVDPTTAGDLTATKPTGPNFIKAIGTVLNSGVGDGSIHVLVAPATTQALDTGDSPQFAGVNLGHASDTTLLRISAGVAGVEGVAIPTISSTNTFTNKRITKRTGTVASSATPTINTDNVDFFSITALAEAITSLTTNLSGTPTEGQLLWIAITGTAARAITWGTSFEASTVALPTTTVTTARLDVGFVWNTVTSKFRCIAVA